ncbi:MAG: nuclear transport factor 2 family protein [Synergistaceae bacterium]|nr:nuclear transport factor 2 family protein [Synergistaceae bacterium]
MNQHELEKAVQRLADIEEIKQLKYRYAEICDDDHNPDRICSVFTEDGVWDGYEVFGRHEGAAAIRKLFVGFQEAIDFSRHVMTNPIITVEGDRGSGQFYLFGPYRARKTQRDFLLAVLYKDEFERQPDGKWLFKKLTADIRLLAPRDHGWEKELIHQLFG